MSESEITIGSTGCDLSVEIIGKSSESELEKLMFVKDFGEFCCGLILCLVLVGGEFGDPEVFVRKETELIIKK